MWTKGGFFASQTAHIRGKTSVWARVPPFFCAVRPQPHKRRSVGGYLRETKPPFDAIHKQKWGGLVPRGAGSGVGEKRVKRGGPTQRNAANVPS